MLGDLDELYRQVIMDHQRRPRNFGDLPGANRTAEGYNPLCGDRIQVALKVGDDDRIAGIGFTGSGCAICTASASMMTEGLKGLPTEEARRIGDAFHALVTGKESPEDAEGRLGKLVVFAGVREFPVRVKCATLPWHTFRAALEGAARSVSTE
jgi:nitrogen fixation NifU-like protein